MKVYEDFELCINVADPDADFPYSTQVLSSPVGSFVSDSEPLRLNLADDELRGELDLVSGDDFDLDARKAFGSRLYQALFHGRVGTAWNQSLGLVDGDHNVAGLRLRLTINAPDVAMLPWELLYENTRHFLATAANQAVSRYLPVPEPPRLQITSALRILLVVASPAGSTQITEQQATQLSDAIAALDNRFDCKLLYNQTREQIRGELQAGYHVLHFLGHGLPGRLLLTLENNEPDILTDEQFAQLVHGRSAQLRLVVLNACNSSQGLKERLFSGVGPSLVQRRIAAVVAMQYTDVHLDTAISFCQAFYRALSSEYPVDVAVNEARGELATGELLETRDWSTPVLYMSTRSGRILNFLGEEEQELLTLRQLAEGSAEAQAALNNLQLSLVEVKGRADRLRDWIILERNLRDLQSAADGFDTMVKKMTRYASRPGWEARETDLDTLELHWKQCKKSIDELDRGMSPSSVLRDDIEPWREEFQAQRPAIDELLAAFLTPETLLSLNGETPKVLDAASERLNRTRNLISSELDELRDMTLRLRSRFNMEGNE